ncbi:MAG: RNA-binding protein [Spirochaetales bacterium]|nr:RNA-binding protein [Spirochaetales bacterium]
MQDSKLYVGNLSYSTSSEKLQGLFAAHGSVVRVNVMEGKGFGFVEMSSQAEAEAAKKALDGTEVDGRNLKVDKARPPSDRPRRSFNNNRY